MINPSVLLWGIIFGSIGLGFFVYGKKQKAIIPLISGLGLMVTPYFVSNPYILIPVGLFWAVLPYFVRI